MSFKGGKEFQYIWNKGGVKVIGETSIDGQQIQGGDIKHIYIGWTKTAHHHIYHF